MGQDLTKKSPVGVVLAGGRGRRMGRDKSQIPWHGVSLVEHTARRLREVTAHVVAADRRRGLVPDLPSLPDGPGAGPAAGILGAAQAYPGRELLVLACDTPEVTVELLRTLVAMEEGDVCLPRWRGPEPLCALYRPRALEALEVQVTGGKFALHALLHRPGIEANYLENEKLLAHGDPERLFANLNTPDDLKRWQELGVEPAGKRLP